MANTLTDLIGVIFEGLDMVSREQVGLIPSVAMSANAQRAAKNQTIRAHVAPAAAASDVTPGLNPPDDGDQTIGKVEMSITKVRRVPIRWNGDEETGLDNNGAGVEGIRADQFAQAFRTLCNEVESDLGNLYVAASRAYGTAGTTPFAFNGTTLSGFEDIAQMRKILVDNGAPQSSLSTVLDTAAGAKLRSLAHLNSAEKTGDVSFLRQGVLLPIHGMDLRESAQIKRPAIGTGASYTTNTAGYAVGATAITLITGTGTILAGDVITFAGDDNKYVVATALTGGVVTLAAPGLQQAIPASATAVSVVAQARRSMSFHRNAIVLATRIPARPKAGDLATDTMIVTDPRSGLSFEIAIYKQYRQVQYEVSLAWGMKVVKPEYLALLLG